MRVPGPRSTQSKLSEICPPYHVLRSGVRGANRRTCPFHSHGPPVTKLHARFFNAIPSPAPRARLGRTRVYAWPSTRRMKPDTCRRPRWCGTREGNGSLRCWGNRNHRRRHRRGRGWEEGISSRKPLRREGARTPALYLAGVPARLCQFGTRLTGTLKEPHLVADTPEAKARQNIDRQLEACGWNVQSRNEANIAASTCGYP